NIGSTKPGRNPQSRTTSTTWPTSRNSPMKRRVPPTSTHPLETPCPPASTPRPLPGWHATYVPHYHGFASCWGCSQSAARKTAKPTHPALGASPRETGAVFDRTAANLRHGKGGKQRVVPITDTVDDDPRRGRATANHDGIAPN